MSTDTQNSRTSGDSRRRRSRGGQNRRNDKNSDRNRTEGRQSGGGKRDGARSAHQGKVKPQRRPMQAPAKLSLWEKLMKMIGLYKEPVRPPRPERRPNLAEPKQTREPRRSKTRDARSENRNGGENRDEERDTRDSGGSARRGKRKDRNTAGSRGGDPSTVENRRVYVGNLSYDTTENDLEELFKGVGAVRRIEIVYNRTTHRSKGFGFVEMVDIDEAKRTVEVLHDQFFMGRKLTVSGAKTQDHESAENEEGANEHQNNTLPKVAPINPSKEQVLDLIDETKDVALIEETHADIPTEEFSPELNDQQDSKVQQKA